MIYIIKLFLPSLVVMALYYRFVLMPEQNSKNKLRKMHKSFAELATTEEYVAYTFLRQINPDSSLLAPAIRNVCDDPDIIRFREMIKDLKSQNEDNPEEMKEILGIAYEYVIDL